MPGSRIYPGEVGVVSDLTPFPVPQDGREEEGHLDYMERSIMAEVSLRRSAHTSNGCIIQKEAESQAGLLEKLRLELSCKQ